MVTGDRAIRGATAGVVCAVAAIAAVVSYSHIYDLGRAHGQGGAAARLLPLSVDGLIMAASLVLLHEARHGRSAPALARVMLWLGIAATVGANIAYGTRFGLLGALISAWPAVAFIGSVELVMELVRRARAPRQAGPDPALAAAPVPPPQARPAADEEEDRDGPLIAAGIRIREQAERDGTPLTRRAFRARLREQGHTIANGRVGWLWAACGFGPGA
jgi:hypothetical protein